ncbi:hypothetical protein J7M07_07290, partial [bacterium]|nr:hypothetical protein [bacterium]
MKLKAAPAIFLLILILSSLTADAAEVSVIYRFDKPHVKDAANGFSRIIFPNTIQAAKPGEPSIPYRKAQILLPTGQIVKNVRIEKRNWEKLTMPCRLHPRQNPIPGK